MASVALPVSPCSHSTHPLLVFLPTPNVAAWLNLGRQTSYSVNVWGKDQGVGQWRERHWSGLSVQLYCTDIPNTDEVPFPAVRDVALINNTCIFILVDTSFATVRDLKLKVHNKHRKLVQAGCAVHRHLSHSVDRLSVWSGGPAIAGPSCVRFPMWSVSPAAAKKYTNPGLQVTKRGRGKKQVTKLHLQ